MPIDVISARDGQCRYVVAPGLFCGDATVAMGSWCARHRLVVFVPKSKRSEEIRRLKAIGRGASRGAPQVVPNGW